MSSLPKRVLAGVVAVVVLALLLVGMQKLGRRGASGIETPVLAKPTVPPGDGVVTGVVKYVGTPPTPETMGEGECCPGAPPIQDESVVVNRDGSLRNVVVYVKNGPPVAPVASANPPVLDQKFCRYVPHVLAVQTDQSFEVTSHDPVAHNVDIQATANPPENFSETTPGATHTVSFARPEFVHFKCDVHPWMSATVAVFDHPFFTVVGDDGRFTIGRLPPGNYTLVAWQEELGELEQPFTVSTTQPTAAPITFEYKPQ